MKSKKKNEWLVATRTEKPPKGFEKNEIFLFHSKAKAMSFIQNINHHNVEYMIAEVKQ